MRLSILSLATGLSLSTVASGASNIHARHGNFDSHLHTRRDDRAAIQKVLSEITPPAGSWVTSNDAIQPGTALPYKMKFINQASSDIAVFFLTKDGMWGAGVSVALLVPANSKGTYASTVDSGGKQGYAFAAYGKSRQAGQAPGPSGGPGQAIGEFTTNGPDTIIDVSTIMNITDTQALSIQVGTCISDINHCTYHCAPDPGKNSCWEGHDGVVSNVNDSPNCNAKMVNGASQGGCQLWSQSQEAVITYHA